MRFVFYVPVSHTARGGISVIMEIIEVLNKNGIEALALYERPDFEYRRHIVRVPRIWSKYVRAPKETLKRRIVQNLSNFAISRNHRSIGNAASCPEWKVKSDDIIVLPEYVAHWLPDQLPEGLKLILFNQNPYALIRSFSYPEFNRKRFAGSLAISDACCSGNKMVLRTEPMKVPLYISRNLYSYEPDKKLQVAYMPRKRERDVIALIKAFQDTPSLKDIPFIPIDGVSTDEAARLLRDSLFFLSFSEREGFGLPAAEAMATGALVTGYTGIGGNEFFNDRTGFPVPEDDLVAFYETAVSVIMSYQENPTALDALRMHASEEILNKYPYAAFEQKIIKVFTDFKNL
jgi:hypothetical protein